MFDLFEVIGRVVGDVFTNVVELDKRGYLVIILLVLLLFGLWVVFFN